MSDQTGPLVRKHGSAKHPERPVAHPRPPGASDAEVEALGKLSEALEAIEYARGHLYGFHRLSGRADLQLQQAVAMFRDCGKTELADDIEQALVGRDVIDGKWTYQLVEAYDKGYYDVFKAAEREARAALTVETPHVFEAEMKVEEQQPDHESDDSYSG